MALKKNISGYALKDVAVFYIMRTNPDVFFKLGRSWDDDEDSYCHVRMETCSLPSFILTFILVLEDQAKGCHQEVSHGVDPCRTYLSPVSRECFQCG